MSDIKTLKSLLRRPYGNLTGLEKTQLVAILDKYEKVIAEAIRIAGQPHYGCTDTQLDHYYDAIQLLKGLIDEDNYPR